MRVEIAFTVDGAPSTVKPHYQVSFSAYLPLVEPVPPL